MASDFGQKLSEFLCSLTLDLRLPKGFHVMNPYGNPEVQRVVAEFCKQYYHGNQERLGIWGINPGRFGAGITGLSFTDPHALTTQLSIATTLTGKRELSAEFIGKVIDAYGGPTKFYADVHLGALSPLGFVKDGKNINFYDDPSLAKKIVPFIDQAVRTIGSFGLKRSHALLLGSGSLQRYARTYLTDLFDGVTLVALDHPRFIMQYRRSKIDDYVKQYVEAIAVYSRLR
ncbi:MAG: DUF4918 family protein [Bradyrhizobiaceae bacterium]|nr:DUF4918 family protein [Bradyrhizobiaceae bacterium]